MAASGVTRAAQNKKIRQDALREQLANKGLCQKVIEDSEKLADLDGKIKESNRSLDTAQIQRLKAANDARLALIKKYLPDLSAVHQTNSDEEISLNEWLDSLDEEEEGDES